MAVGTERLSRGHKLPTRELGIVFLVLAAMGMLLYLWQGRETPVPRVDRLSASAIENSGAFARERGASVTEPAEAIFGSGAYVREAAGVAAVALTPEAIENSVAAVREEMATASAVLSPEAFQNSGASVREVSAAAPAATDSFGTWTHAREAVAPGVFSTEAIFNSGAYVREAGMS